MIGPDGTLRYVSPSVQSLLGWEPAALTGRNGFELLAPESAEVAIALFAEAQVREDEVGIAGNQPSEIPLLFMTPEGTTRALLVSGHEAFTPSVEGIVVRARPLDAAYHLDDYLVALHESDSLESVLEPLLRRLGADIPAAGMCFVHDWQRDRFTAAVSADPAPVIDPLALDPLAGADDRDALPWIRARTEGVIIQPTVADMPRALGEAAVEAGVHACWCFPIAIDGHTAGVLVIWRRSPGPPWGTEDRVIEQVRGFIELAVAHREHEAALAHAVSHDSLTGVGNRSSFFEELRTLTQSSDDAVAVLYLDLDGFKPVNDHWGHDVGDQVLADVARALQRAVGVVGRVSRLGGDEFAVACSAPDPAAIISLAHRLVDAASRVVEIDGVRLPVRASVGVAYGDRTLGEAILSVADEAMYSAKRRGGNQVWVAGSP